MPPGSEPKRPSPRSKKNTVPRGDQAPPKESDQPVEATGTVTVAAETKPKRGKTRTRGARAKPRAVLLPVLVVDETILLPHMSIPFAIEDDEAAMVLDRAMRLPSRQVLVLTERRINPPPDGATAEDPGVDGVFRELVADALADVMAEEEDALVAEAPAVAPAPDGERPENADEEWQATQDDIEEEYELCSVGVIAEVGHRISRPGGQAHVILQGIARGVVEEIVQQDPYVVARVTRRDDVIDGTAEAEAAMSAVLEQVESYISMLPNVPEEVLTMVRSVDEPGWLADLIAFSPEFTPEQRQELLEQLDPIKRLRHLSVVIQKRLNVLNLRQQIQHEAQAGMDRQQREYFLREQMRAIQKELGEGSSEETVAAELRQKIEAAGMPEEVKAKALVQIDRLEQQHPFSPEIGVIRTYLEWLTELPWAVETEDRLDLNEAAAIL